MDDKIEGLLAAIRPVRFDSGGFLWGVGSAALLRFNGGLYCLTSDHVITNQKAKYEDVRVMVVGERPAAIPFSSYLRPQSDKLDPDQLDIVIFKVVEPALERYLGRRPPAIDLDRRFHPAKHMPTDCPLVVAGYPDTDDRYDYDNGVLRDHLLIRDGRKSDSPYGEPVFQIISAPTDHRYRGMSGSPVFGWIAGRLFLVGVAIRGSSSSGIIHFIDSTLALVTIRQLSAGAGKPLPLNYSSDTKGTI